MMRCVRDSQVHVSSQQSLDNILRTIAESISPLFSDAHHLKPGLSEIADDVGPTSKDKMVGQV